MPKIRIQVKPALLGLIPTYLERRRRDVTRLRELARTGDFGEIQMLGHKLSGNASTYGFARMSEIGRELEQAGLIREAARIEPLVSELHEYLSQIEIVVCDASEM